MSPADRARAAHAAAEAAREAGADPRDVAALRAAASLWERVAGPGLAMSTKGLRRDVRALRIDVAIATGPFTPKQPPKAPSPAREPLIEELKAAGGPAARALAVKLEEATIEF
ncbi:MAG TPA: hypothetical protein VNZ53_19255 [Steroidobacteraceae bacterium]|jgi:hypothetical protein|nr:hypothetical protein [Steroidobacteraceae bacterium]